MADTLPDRPLLFLAARPGDDLATYVDDASLPAVTDAAALAAYRDAVAAVDRFARVATRRAADLHAQQPHRGVALSAVERGTADALASLRTVALASGVERAPGKG